MGPHPQGEADELTAVAIVTAAGYTLRLGTIRVWATRGKVRRVGRDPDGRVLYAFADIWRWVTHGHGRHGV